MAELADAPASGAGARKGVKVQVLSFARIAPEAARKATSGALSFMVASRP